MPAKTSTNSRDLTGELAFLTRALKAPTLRDAVDRLAARARAAHVHAPFYQERCDKYSNPGPSADQFWVAVDTG